MLLKIRGEEARALVSQGREVDSSGIPERDGVKPWIISLEGQHLL